MSGEGGLSVDMGNSQGVPLAPTTATLAPSPPHLALNSRVREWH